MDDVTVAGVSHTVTAGDADLAAVAAALKNALVARPAIAKVYDITAASGVITFTQKFAGTGDQPTASVSESATITATAKGGEIVLG